jgi:hypothetical protein
VKSGDATPADAKEDAAGIVRARSSASLK